MDNTINLAIPILAGVISSYLTYYLTNKSKRNEAIVKYKEEKYTNLLLKLQGFIGVTTSGETKKEFFEEQYQSWLYCSDEVVEAMNKMVQLVIDGKGKAPDPHEGQEAIGNIVLAMRKDLLGKTNLDYKAFRYTDVLE